MNKSNAKENVLERCVVDCERAVIIHALIKTKGKQLAAANLLGTTKRSLNYKIRKYKINFELYKIRR